MGDWFSYRANFFFGLIGLGLVVLSVLEGINEGSVFFIIFMGISAVFLGLSWYAYKNLQKYVKLIVKIDLGETGYDYYVKDKKKGEEKHTFISYKNMNYVLIGMDYRLMPKHAGEGTALITLRTAKMMMYGVSSDNQLEVLSFTHSNQAALEQWIKIFQKHGVGIYHTEKALTATPNTPEGIEAVPKRAFEGTLSFDVGSEAEDMDNIFLTEDQEDLAAEKEKKRRKHGVVVTIILAVLQIVMIYFWFPTWEISGTSFSDDSGEIFAFLLTIFLQIFIYWYMQKVKWYEPIRDMVILYIGIFIGRTLLPDDREAFHTAVEEYAFMVIGCLLFFCNVYKLYSWIKKIRKNSRRRKQKMKLVLPSKVIHSK